MADSFGARMRRQREEQGVALTAVAEQTKIKASLLEAMERDDVKYWPTGIFRRAFIRSYAHAIGLDPDVVVRDFLEIFPDSVEVETPAQAAGAEGIAKTAAATRLRALVGSAMASISPRRREPSPPPATPEPLPTPPALLPAAPPAREPDLLALARLSTEFARADSVSALKRLLKDAAAIFDARGMIVWLWDAAAAELKPAVTYGYSDRVIARLRAVSRDADNATAAAFRTSEACAIDPNESSGGALAVPLLTPAGCAGVLAIEWPPGTIVRTRSARAGATIVAALLAQLTVTA